MHLGIIPIKFEFGIGAFFLDMTILPAGPARQRIKLRQLEVLRAVAACGTMGRAAERLATTQPVISKAIAELERAVGAVLFERGPHGVELTAYGRVLLKRSTVIFDELRGSLEEIAFLADPAAGELRIGCADSMLSGILPVIINRLLTGHPRLSFRVTQALSGAALYDELRERNVDLVIGKAGAEETHHDLEQHIVFEEQQIVVAGARSPWVRRRSIKLSDLMNERWVLPSADSAGGLHVTEVFRACGLPLPSITVFSTSIQLYNALVASGPFLAMLPSSVLSFAPHRPPVRVLPVKLPRLPWPIGLTALKDRTANPVARLFIDCAREVAKHSPTNRPRAMASDKP